MKKVVVIFIVVVLVVIAAVIALYVSYPKGPKFEEVKHLVEPQIIDLPKRNVISCKVSGTNPESIVAPAIKKLYSVQFRAKGIPKDFKFYTIHARWNETLVDSAKSFVGEIALLVPDDFSQLPSTKDTTEPVVSLSTWEYGKTAQILHVGAYDKEMPTVEKLKAFVEKNGYEFAGPHEEVYLSGPTIFGAGNPEKYLTLIRYKVRKIDENAMIEKNDSLVTE